MPARLRVFVLLVVTGAVLAVVQLVLRSDGISLRRDRAACLVLVAMVVLAELLPLRMTRADGEEEFTVSTPFSLALTLAGGLELSVLAMCLTVVVEDLRRGKAAVKWAFNAGQYAISLTASAAVFGLLTGQPVLRQLHPLELPGELPAALAAGAVYWAVNSLLTSTAVALSSGEPVIARLLAEARFQAATNARLLAIMPVVVVSAEQSVWLLPLLALPVSGLYVSAELTRRLRREALHDGLTGLPNRALFDARVTRLCQEAGSVPAGGTGGAGPPTAAVMLLDLDHFKEINDTLGHQTGDQLLRAVAERLSDCLRPGDTVARLGGDEFALLAPGLDDATQALLVGQRVLRALAEPFSVAGVRLEVEASLGVALHPHDGDHMDALLRRADIALYAAKVERSCVRMYDVTQDPHTLERLALASDLRAGLDQHQLMLHHQPKVDLTTGRVVGFEALVRWHHPRHGVLMPDAFLPVVENTGLIGPLTLEVLELALVDVARWRAAGHDVSVAVNLSVRHLTDLSLPDQVRQRLAAHDLPPSALVLEVTETLIMTDPGRAVTVLALLRELGVGLAVDDFGTGYSSLAYLRRLHVDELKIDRSFVLDLSSDPDNAVIVRSTIELGHNLGLSLVAEGVEDEAALALLREWGCDTAQGYLLARPMPAEAVLPWLSRRQAGPALPVAEPSHPRRSPASITQSGVLPAP